MSRRVAFGISVGWIPLAFMGDGFAALVLPVMLAGHGQGPTTLGLLSFLGIGAAVAVQPFCGALSDRLRERVGRRALLVASAAFVFATLLALAGATTVAMIAIAFIAVQLAASGLQATQQTLIPEHVSAGAWGRASGLKTAFDIGGAFTAFLVLGILLETAGAQSAIVATSVALAGALAIIVVCLPARTSAPVAPRSGAALAPGFMRLVAARFLFLLGVYGVGRFLALLVADRLGIEAAAASSEAGGVLALFTLITAGSAVVGGSALDRIGYPKAMTVGALIGASGALALLPATGLPGILAAGTVMSIGTALFITANWAAITAITPPGDAGRLLGLANIGTGGAAACAGLLGPVIDGWGWNVALLGAAAAMIAAHVPLGYGRQWRVREQPA